MLMKKWVSLFVSAALVLTLFPAAVFADDAAGTTADIITEEAAEETLMGAASDTDVPEAAGEDIQTGPDERAADEPGESAIESLTEPEQPEAEAITGPEAPASDAADPAAETDLQGGDENAAEAPETITVPETDPLQEDTAEPSAPEQPEVLTEEPEQPEVLSEEPEQPEVPVTQAEEEETTVRPAATKDRTADISLNGRTLSFSATEEDLDYFDISFWRHKYNAALNTVLYRFRYYPAYKDLYLYWVEDGVSQYYHADMWVSGSSITHNNGVYRMDPFAFFDEEIVNTTLYWFSVEAVYTDGDYVSADTDFIYGGEINGVGDPILGYVHMDNPNTYPGRRTTCTCHFENLEDMSKVRYQWQQNWNGPEVEEFWENIAGATQEVFVPTDEDMGSYLRLTVSAEGYSGVLKSGKTYVLRSLPITSTYFKDAAFREILQSKKYDKDQNNHFNGSEISEILELDLSNSTVEDLMGIQYLTALTELDLSGSTVVNADLRGLVNLTRLDLSSCYSLSTLDISECQDLKELDLHDTNTAYLYDLDLSANPDMTYLNLIDSSIRTLDLRNCPNLRSTALYGTITDSHGAEKIPGTPGYTGDSYFSWNGCELKINDSPGSGLSVYIATFDAADFSCAVFRKLVQDRCGDSRHTPGILDLSESQGFEALDYGDTWDKEVISLKGIRYLPRLIRLYGGDDWNISYANLNQNTELTELDLGGNKNLIYLSLLENPGLEKVYLRSTGLKSLNLSQNPRMRELDLSGCENLKNIELKTAFASQLRKLDVSRCDLSGTLDVTSRRLLEELYCFGNYIKTLDLSACPELKKLHCYDNNLTVINISQNPHLLEAYNNGTGEEKTDRFGLEYLDYSYNGYELFVSPATRVRTTPEELSISLNKYSADLATTKTLQLIATIKPASEEGRTISWKSSDTSIATVSSGGLVKAKKYGKVKITASTGGKKAICTIQTRFYDVNDKGRSYYEPVYWAVNRGITKCTVAFRPDDGVTRGEFVAFLYRYAGSPAVSNYVTTFKDVNSGTKFYKEISWAVNKGIIKGFSDKTFRPEDTLTREQCAVMIWRYAGRPTPNTTKSPFSDVKKSGADSYKAILWGAENGIIKGSKGKFLPKDLCTRANVVTFLHRYNNL